MLFVCVEGVASAIYISSFHLFLELLIQVDPERILWENLPDYNLAGIILLIYLDWAGPLGLQMHGLSVPSTLGEDVLSLRNPFGAL